MVGDPAKCVQISCKSMILKGVRIHALLDPAIPRALLCLLRTKGGVRLRNAVQPGETAGERAARLAHLMERLASLLPLRFTCLERAAALAAMLRAEGLQSHLRIAVRRGGAQLDAHAWVEHDGVALLPVADDGFVPLETPAG